MSADPASQARPRARPRPSTAALIRDVTILGTIWGSSVVCQRLAVAEVDPVTLVAVRLAAALVFFVPFVGRLRAILSWPPRRVLDIALVGSVNPALCGILSGAALQFASSGLVGVLVSLAPLFTALLAKLLLDEPSLRKGQLGGLAVAFAGVAVLIATRSTGLGATGDLRGHLLALTVAGLMAMSVIYTRRRLAGNDPLAGSAGQNFSGLVAVAPFALLFGEPAALAGVSGAAWLAIVVSGTLGLGGSFVLYLGMLERHGPIATLLALYVMPVAAAILGALLLGETLTPPMIAGATLVLAGVVLFTRR